MQSGLSNSLQALQRELGTPLYIRGTRPVRLTAAGEALEGPARRTLNSAAQAEHAVHHTRDVLIGTLRLGVSLSAQHLVPFASYLGEFTRDHPGIDLRLPYAPALDMISMVETGELDCVIGPAVSQDHAGVRLTHGKPKVNGVEIHYAIGGAGEPVFLLHGTPKTMSYWRHVVPLLTPHYTVIAVDNQGAGGSPLDTTGHARCSWPSYPLPGCVWLQRLSTRARSQASLNQRPNNWPP